MPTTPPLTPRLSCCLTLLLLCASPSARAQPTAELIGVGTVSTSAAEFATSVSADGTEIFFNRANDDRSRLVILVAKRRGEVWTEAEPLPFSDGTYRDVDPFITADGDRLFFSSNRPSLGDSEPGDFDIWYVERTAAGGWGDPINPGAPVNSEATEIYSTLSRQGHLYFGSDREGESYIYRSRWANGKFAEPERLVLGNDMESVGSNPAINPDETLLVFSAHRDDGMGGSDLYMSSRTDKGWTVPRPLGEPVNSASADFAPTFDWNRRYLYFTSERPGVVPADAVAGRPPGDLYRVEWTAAFPAKTFPEDWLSPGTLAAAVYSLVSGPAGQPRDWDRYRALFASGAQFTTFIESERGVEVQTFGVEDYIRYYQGSFDEQGIHETEIWGRTEQYRHMAQRWGTCEYRWGNAEGPASGRSQVTMQFVRDDERWWIVSMIWQTESADHPIAARYLPKTR